VPSANCQLQRLLSCFLRVAEIKGTERRKMPLERCVIKVSKE
jgi:hypothetical protein